VLPRVAVAAGAGSVHIAADHGPYGRERDRAVQDALATDGVDLVRTGSPYAVAPGRVRKHDGEPYRVFTPFAKAWRAHGWRAPAGTDVSTVDWIDPAGSRGRVPIPGDEQVDARLPEAGEPAALRAWAGFRDRLRRYGTDRDRPDLPGTSRMSPYLKYGCVHPRTLLADLDGAHAGRGADTYRTELAWREFYADVLWHRPDSARRNYRRAFDTLVHDTGPEARDRFGAWCEGRTGYPIVDAGMRQLSAQAWMHNRVRMIVASFLVKDLHLPWWDGARHFMRHLVDGDLASNQHGWQWTAGTGTDAAPYFRVFNPVSQGRRFDPDGDYVRRYVPELRAVAGAAVHAPWELPGGIPAGYPEPIVDHGHERQVALERYGVMRDRSGRDRSGRD
jgi:deoxyribodipyrimidine photo-lyase